MGRKTNVEKYKLASYDQTTHTSRCRLCDKVLKGNLLGNIKRHYTTLHKYNFEDNIMKLNNGKKYRSLESFEGVSAQMEEVGFFRTPDQIRTKLKSLKKTYNEIKKTASSPESIKQEVEYFDTLEEIFENSNGNESRADAEDASANTEEADIAEDPYEFEAASDPIKTQSDNESTPEPTPKRKKHQRLLKDDLEDYKNVKEELMVKHQQWWSNELEKQRQHEERQNSLFLQQISSIVANLVEAIKK